MSIQKDQLIMKGISKTFPGVKALDEVSFEIISGEVHSLIGQNGAGKSTLMGILNGITKPDDGQILFNNKVVKIDDPKDAFNLNLSIVHQEFALCNNLTVAENIYLGDEPHNKSGFVNYKKMHLDAKILLDSINVNLNTNKIVGNLNTSQWQIIEICKALAKKPKFIVMDEPTASLDEKQIDNLFEIINTLKNNGIGIIYISHKLKEIIHISDRITVLKDGKINDSFLKNEVNEEGLIKSMIGKNISIKNNNQNIINFQKPILKINNYSYSNTFKKIRMDLYEGEILGLSGLLGSGANELLRCIFGIIKQDNGQLSLNDKVVTINKPRDAIVNGIGYIPSDRKNEGLIQNNSIKDNSVLTIFNKLTKMGFFKFNAAAKTTDNYVKKLDIKASNIDSFVMNLSGGNQQKVVIAKWLVKNCKILLFDEPTRGIDIAAKTQIWKLISEFTNEGGSVIVVSNEIPELIINCNRIITMQKGLISNKFNHEDFNEQKISLNISSK
ncbi:MAG: sugar ABC transporter ATP-binding protein [Pelagibacteraceae bacterium]|nr:sugar ABC transporter ATP-binding protein [Pelagibacteraceae bacterium]